jgi:uncharacterized protein
MIHPDTELRYVNDAIGYGVFATRPIPRGTVIWAHDPLDQVLTPARLETLPAALQTHARRYAFVNAAQNLVLCWDHGRYMNHACDPATTSIGTLLEIARRDIVAWEHITYESGLAQLVEPFDCRCGAPTCRGTLVYDDRDALYRRWDREAREAFTWALTVDQPVLAAVDLDGPGAPILRALVERRAIELPSWFDGVPGGA